MEKTVIVTKDLESVYEAILDLDLDCIKFKLADDRDGEGWSRDKADKAEVWYKRFLFLNYKYRGQPIVVDKTLDTFWHYHILDTLKYSEDCNATLGYFLHHFPYFGMRGDMDRENMNNAFEITLDLFKKEFGEEFPKFEGGATCADPCSSPCSNVTGASFNMARPKYSYYSESLTQ